MMCGCSGNYTPRLYQVDQPDLTLPAGFQGFAARRISLARQCHGRFYGGRSIRQITDLAPRRAGRLPSAYRLAAAPSTELLSRLSFRSCSARWLPLFWNTQFSPVDCPARATFAAVSWYAARRDGA
jgi:hypothetical protein